ncbi:NAD(P)-dependent oxidoreductase [Marinomonas sp. 15G1-11]|uniref:NAD(P)-dependent oxidoreductase n=1 Tax=Marinomonas phaeophyticola TaxID=3004091 RepID=A0ABT4JU10_9GAMM|nr:NAD(P)-dependent oxidoreductase [Marinomonas sp. 15G1-11]MCZ2721883.1 NAD(P)-dependent oxidoreductase [Marinomonas sp. 15G1-11]
MNKKVAFIGLGTMGFPMAGHLSSSGYAVTVFNRTASKAEHWTQIYSGAWAKTPAEAAEAKDVVFTCVGNDNDLREVYLGENGAFAKASAGTIFVDHTTASAEVAQELAVIAMEKGCYFLDAPVSGGQAGAENGVLTVMVGGEASILEQTQNIIESYSKAIVLQGPVGHGQIAKMVNQILIAGVLSGLSEGIRFAKTAGLDIATLVETLKYGAAGSWQLENRGETMARDQFDFGFAIEWMHKDLGLCLDQAQKMTLDLPLTKDVDEKYQQLISEGHGRCDTSVLIKSLK